MDSQHPRTPQGASLLLLVVTLLMPIAAGAQTRGVQLTPDSERILVNKDIGSERWAITQNQDDTTLTGNVFRAGGGAPAFVFCEPIGGGVYRCFGADACTSGGAQRGIQNTPDARRIIVNKDVGSERWAISRNLDDGTVTGNVFRSDGGAPAFIFCEPTGGNNLRCQGANACQSAPCVGGFSFVADVSLPADFFSVPVPCGDSYDFIGDVTIPQDFFLPPDTERSTANSLANDIQEQAKPLLQIGIGLIGSAQSIENRAAIAGQSTFFCAEGGFYTETSDSIEFFSCQEDGVVTNGLTTFSVDDITGEVFVSFDDNFSVFDVFTGEQTFYAGTLSVLLDGDFLITNGSLGVASNVLGSFFIDFFDLEVDGNLVPLSGAFFIEVVDGFGDFSNLHFFTYEALGFQIDRVTIELLDGTAETWIFAFTLCDPCTTSETCADGLGCFECDDQCVEGGVTSRCSLLDDFVQCADGSF